jgi:membrane-associated protease RseP (regulator of RpoE activity)
MHFILAILLMVVVLGISGKNYRDASLTTTIADVGIPRDESPTGDDQADAPGPAALAGVREGDRLVAIDGEPVDEWGDVRRELRDRGGETVPFTVERDGERLDLDVALARENPYTREQTGFAGISPTIHVPHVSPVEAVFAAPRETAEVGVDSVKALGKIFSPSGIANYIDVLGGDENADENARPVSPVGFVRLGAQAVQSSWIDVFGLLIAINVFVGIFNLVPLLPFDGGHIAVATYEFIASRLRRRPVHADVTKLLPITAAVVAVLALLFASSLFLDIANPVNNPF